MSLYVGLMSGTSVDGADAALVDLSSATPRTLAFATVPFSSELRQRILKLSEPGEDRLDLAGAVSLELADVYALAVRSVLAKGGIRPEQVTAIGCHGQTVRHRPERGFTIQVNDPARLAELSCIDVVADFRRRDMAAGGQGAPLVPAFHEAMFRHPSLSRAVVNIGGISNITWLPVSGPTLGFDCGPGNVLLDHWASIHLGVSYDENGEWAARGQTVPDLLHKLLDEPFLGLMPPKSTGRELFRLDWLQSRLDVAQRPDDVQSTLTDFTARAIVNAIERFCPGADEIYLAGGGARNGSLVSRISRMAGTTVALTDTLGVPTGHVESMAFAWLAKKCVDREPVDLTTVTGAKQPRILGAIYPR
ncbi:MAG TPA: anhydro-N-acetylmuramic acid kinase [Gemmatimonadaceae bacterium]|nr:anhydro-N-acetylmuramic acid kinase [Gemmatimonadaceae bacterium]